MHTKKHLTPHSLVGGCATVRIFRHLARAVLDESKKGENQPPESGRGREPKFFFFPAGSDIGICAAVWTLGNGVAQADRGERPNVRPRLRIAIQSATVPKAPEHFALPGALRRAGTCRYKCHLEGMRDLRTSVPRGTQGRFLMLPGWVDS